jgi:hypothetical protein
MKIMMLLLVRDGKVRRIKGVLLVSNSVKIILPHDYELVKGVKVSLIETYEPDERVLTPDDVHIGYDILEVKPDKDYGIVIKTTYGLYVSNEISDDFVSTWVPCQSLKV